MEDKQRPSKNPTIWEALGMAWDLLITVFATALFFALLGIGLDRLFGTAYVFKAVSFVLMIPIGYRIIAKKGKEVAKRLEGRTEKPPEEPKDDHEQHS